MSHDNSRSRGIKKSDFVAKTTITDADTLDFVSGNTNFKILFSDFILSLGVTGTIVQQGDPLGTPVLDPDGTVNNIRNLENGPGVKASVSALDGIKLEHNFDVDATGEPLMQDVATLTPDFISLVAKLGITLTTVGKTIEILNNGALQIQEEIATYQALVNDDIINTIGTFTVTLPAILSAIKTITITSTSGTITLAADATIEAPTTVTTGSSVTLYPARGQWWHR